MLSRSEGEELQRKMVKGDYKGVQRICLSSCMITDHLSNRCAWTIRPFSCKTPCSDVLPTTIDSTTP